MFLKMFIGRLFIDRVPVEFIGFDNVLERQMHLERLADDMYWKYVQKIKAVGAKATFYLDNVESKMNDL